MNTMQILITIKRQTNKQSKKGDLHISKRGNAMYNTVVMFVTIIMRIYYYHHEDLYHGGPGWLYKCILVLKGY